MYEEHWGLTKRPFEDIAQASEFFSSAPHQGAELKLRYAVENGRGAAVLTGIAGVGKSLLVHRLMEQLPERFAPCVHIVFPQLPHAQLVSYLTAEICQADPADELQANIRRLGQFLKENSAQGNHATLVVDEAHLLSDPQTLEALRLLLNFEFDGERCLSLILVGQPQMLNYLARCPGLDDRIAVRSLIRPFTEEETYAYIDHRLETAGAQQEIFEEAAQSSIFHHSGGVARRVNRLCDLALLVGFAEQRNFIDAAQIEAISEEIVSVRPEAA
jgi:general secretion pathway protein A